jgi:alkylation response protein AidB-like acyl-CoA dehydrogenase
MNLLPDEQQLAITDMVRSFLDEQLPVRRYQDAGSRGAPYPSPLWSQLVDLGWFGIGVAEVDGGMGLGLADEMLLAREAGRHLTSPTVLGTSLGIHLLARANKPDLCGELTAGKARVALALATNVQIDGDRVSAGLSIFDGQDAQYILACDQHGCLLVDANNIESPAVAACTDESLAMTQATLNAAGVVAVSTDPAMRRIFALFLAAALTGIAEAARDDAAGYAIEREQFGRAIGSFQAINHLCADMAVLAEASWAQCAYAALALQNNDPDAAQAVASAAVVAERAALDNARNNIQIHGGVGFTVEYDAHYYAKRSHVYRQLGRACLSTLDELVPRTSEPE